MALFIVQLIGLILGLIGTILTIIVTAMTQWRVSYMVEGNAVNCDKRIDGQWLSRWDGLWLTCITKNQNSMECKQYESLVIITTDLKAGRVLMSFAVVIAIIAFIIAIVALICVRWCRRARDGRYCLLLTAGVGFILAGILVLIPIVWTTSNIIREINNPVCKTMQRLEIGEAIFLGWPTMLFLLIAGAILCWYRPCDEEEDDDRCKNNVYSSQTSLPRPVYVQCQTQEKTPSQIQYSRSQYI
ncbi:PREDICTED: claudin-8-like [Nanorana parkeri]|uniref:claudin-8-like n=1 Tax=Nanorana parkeri TaxID=125878 RepID=UPI0008543B00|nr:PREDICTED: claudin-8-like [Nanorana parkeri]